MVIIRILENLAIYFDEITYAVCNALLTTFDSIKLRLISLDTNLTDETTVFDDNGFHIVQTFVVVGEETILMGNVVPED